MGLVATWMVAVGKKDICIVKPWAVIGSYMNGDCIKAENLVFLERPSFLVLLW